EFRFILPSKSPSLEFPRIPVNSLIIHFEKFSRQFFIASNNVSPFNSSPFFYHRLQVWFQNAKLIGSGDLCVSASRRILPTEDAMVIGNSRGSLDHFTRDMLGERWWSMSPTSQLAHHPFGAAVARLSHPAGASGGGGEGWSIPLVSQSERARRRTMDWSHCARDAQTLVGLRQRQMQPPGTSVCASEVGPIFVGVPVALLCVVTVVSAWHGEPLWGGGLTMPALTAAILAVVSLFVGAVWLSISDWMAE